MIPQINATEIQQLAQGTSFEIVSGINQSPFFLIPLIIAIVIPILLFLFLGLVVGKGKRLITRDNYWILFIPFLLQLIIVAFVIIFPVYFLLS